MSRDNWTAILSKNASLAEEQDETNKDEQETTTPADSSTEEEQTETSPASQGDTKTEASAEVKENTGDGEKEVPFHLHPRWKEVQEKNKKLSDIVEKLAPMAEEFPRLREQLSNLSNQQPQLPDDFKKLFGEDPSAYKSFQGMLEQQLKQVEEKIRASIRQEQEQSRSLEEKQLESIASSVHEQVEEAFGVSLPRNSSDYNSFLKFTNDLVQNKRAPMYPDGNGGLMVNFGAAWELYQQGKAAEAKPKVESRKKIAEKMGVAKAAPKETESDEYTMDNYPIFKRKSRR